MMQLKNPVPDGEIVSLKRVSFSFDHVPILDDISFTIRQDDFIVVVGPNGGGKTTLLKVILGLLRPDRGEVNVFGKSPREGRKLIGYLPQYAHSDLDFPISVFDVVLMGRYRGAFTRYTTADREATAHALEIVEMGEYRDRQIGKLSGGQLHRVFMARALAREPKLLLLDEPTTHIDPEMQESFYKMLSELRKKMAVVMVTHDIGAVSVHAEDIACLNRRLFYHGPKEEGLQEIEKAYHCPVHLIEHGEPHRILRRHGNDD